LRPAILADTEVGDELRRRYLEPLDATRSAAELLTTLREYFASGMHVERAADALSVHQNTLRYRISRFEELTGANRRDPRVAFEVWWALELAAANAVRA
jgi:DNA-binding PucR family transcriptional regulator